MSNYDSDLTARAVEMYMEDMRTVERFMELIRGKASNECEITRPDYHNSAYYEEAGGVVLRSGRRILMVYAVGPDEALTALTLSVEQMERLKSCAGPS